MMMTPKTLDEDQLIDLTIFSNNSLALMLDNLQVDDIKNEGEC